MLKVNHTILCPKASLASLVPETLMPRLETRGTGFYSSVAPGSGVQLGTEQVLLKVVPEEGGDPAAAAAPSPGFPMP